MLQRIPQGMYARVKICIIAIEWAHAVYNTLQFVYAF